MEVEKSYREKGEAWAVSENQAILAVVRSLVGLPFPASPPSLVGFDSGWRVRV